MNRIILMIRILLTFDDPSRSLFLPVWKRNMTLRFWVFTEVSMKKEVL
jgi:hypothetical protein